MGEIIAISPRLIFRQLESAWKCHPSSSCESKQSCQETVERDFFEEKNYAIQRCNISYTAVTKGFLDKGFIRFWGRGEKDPDLFYEKGVTVDNKPYLVQVLQRMAPENWVVNTSFFDLKIFNQEGDEIARLVMSNSAFWEESELVKGPPDFVKQAVDALCF